MINTKFFKCISALMCCLLLFSACRSTQSYIGDDTDLQDKYDYYDDENKNENEGYDEISDEDYYPLSFAVSDLMSEEKYDNVDAIVNALKDDFYMDYVYDCDFILDTRTNVYHDVLCPEVENISSRYIQCIYKHLDSSKELIANASKHQCPEPEFPNPEELQDLENYLND